MTAQPGKLDVRAKELFAAALERPEAARAAFLAQACGDDRQLRAALQTLLRGFDEAERRFDDTVAPPQFEQAGDRIGHYRLLQQIGEGGFGVVWMAEQEEPVRRKVALKVLKAGMDTAQVVGRFEAERQALALMDHPNIAKVFDGGATAQGRPYFVMELVKGVPITQFCDDAGLGMAQRLELFVPVCQAVQHAHQKGVIHRDLKPSNVLVTLHDGEPVPKVIDFGIAKATAGSLTQRTVFTEFRQMLGTPEYMAPEQAELSSLDVDTRADIYSLGVLLYELLTGTRPFELKTLLQAGYAEILRTIKEVDPPKPSTRVSTLGEKLLSVAKHRSVHPRAFGAQLRGDLDWIVMKSLEKQRNRRYETATALAEDVLRHLRNEPVLAGPPSRLYRWRKYAIRHRVGVMAGAAVTGALLAGLLLSLYGLRAAEAQAVVAKEQGEAAILARDAEQRQKEAAMAAQALAEQQRQLALRRETEAHTATEKALRVVDLLRQLLASSDPYQLKGRDYSVRQLLDDFDRELGNQLAGEPEVEATLRALMGRSFSALSMPERAEPHLQQALSLRRQVFGADGAQVAESLLDLARVHAQRWQHKQAEQCCRGAMAIRERRGESESEGAADAACDLADNLIALGRYQDAVTMAQQGLRLRRVLHPGGHGNLASALLTTASALLQCGRLAEAETLARESLTVDMRALGPDNPLLANRQLRVAEVLKERGEVTAAVELCQQAVELRRRLFGDPHVAVAEAMGHLGNAMTAAGRHQDAVNTHQQAVDMRRQLRGPNDPQLVVASFNLAKARQLMGEQAAAVALMREVWAQAQQVYEPGDLGRTTVQCGLAQALQVVGENKEAERLYREALGMKREILGDDNPEVAMVRGDLGLLLAGRGKVDEAEQHLRAARDVLATTHGPEHELTAAATHNLGLVLERKGDFAAAATMYEQGLAARRSWHGERSEAVAASRGSLASVLQKLGRSEEAELHMRAAVDIIRGVSGGKHPSLMTALNNLGWMLESRGDHDGAEAAFREALQVGQELLGADSVRLVATMHNLASVLLGKGEVDAAVAMAVDAVGRYRAEYDVHPDLAMALCLLGRTQEAENDFVAAEASYREALDMLQSMFGTNHASTVTPLSRLASLAMSQGEHAKATPWLRAWLAVQRRGAEGWPLALTGAMESLALALAAQGGELATEAVDLLQESLGIWAKHAPDDWQRFRTMSFLGALLCERDQAALAEPLLVEAAEKMRPPAEARGYRREAIERVVQLYEKLGKKAQLAEWRAKLETVDK